jgi:hypothetical protein
MRGHVENVFEFNIGDTVNASRRKVPPLNEEGGMARVTKIHLVGGRASYDIQYILDHRQEHRLESSVLTRHDLSQDDQRRPKRTQIAAKFGKRHHHSYD